MADAGIVRNRLKVDAAITNAAATVALRDSGGLEAFVAGFRPDHQPAPRTTEELATTSAESVALSKALKKQGLRLRRPHDHVRPDGGRRPGRRPPGRVSPAGASPRPPRAHRRPVDDAGRCPTGWRAELAPSGARPFLGEYDVVLTHHAWRPRRRRSGHLDPNPGLRDLLQRLVDWVAFTPLQNASGEPAVSLPLATTCPEAGRRA